MVVLLTSAISAADEVGAVVQDCPQCPEMVAIPAGAFIMGSRGNDRAADLNEQPQRQVTVPAFLLATHEVTRTAFAAFVDATGHEAAGCQIWDGRSVSIQDDVDWRTHEPDLADDEPVACVSRADAVAYAGWLTAESGQTYRLPSEAEWEYAARAGAEGRYLWGDDVADGCAFANFADKTGEEELGLASTIRCTDGFATTAPVASLAANDFGLHDMIGNLSEWTADCWNSNYIVSPPRDGSAWMTGECDRHPVRGGSWADDAGDLRLTARSRGRGSSRNNLIGFRLAQDL